VDGKTILLVEDEALIAMSEAILLQKYGCQVITAYSGEQALETVAITPIIDLVLMDIDLGKGRMDGTQAAGLILQLRDLPLVFLSAHTEREVVEKTEGITSYGYIVKNSGETVLIASIRMAFRLFEARRLERQKEAVLRESEERFRLSMEATQDGLWDRNLAADTVYCSPAYWKMLGYDPNEPPVGAQDWYTLIHPDDRAAALRANQECEENRCDSFVIEFRMRTKSGAWRWIQSRGKASSRTAEGRALRMVGTHSIMVGRDITSRKRLEEMLTSQRHRLDYIIQGTNVGTWEWNVQTGELTINDRWAEIIGYACEELLPISVATWNSLTHPVDLQASNDLLARHFKGEADFYECEVRMRHKNGDWVWILDRGKVAIWTEDGRPLLMCGTHQDITRRKQAEANLEKALSEKQGLLKELQHRAKNSFAMITSLISLRENASQDQAAREALEEVRTRVNALSDLYDMLFTADTVTEVLLDAYCVKVLSSFPFPSNVRVVQSYEPIIVPVKIAAPLGLILIELLTNAVKHAFPGGRYGTVSVSLHRVAEEIILVVKDDGIGLPPEFDPAQSNSLGLSLVQGLSRQIQGSFQLERVEGSRGVVKFPLPDRL